MRVLAFGTFDPLHQGHQQFLASARQLGTHLTVIVARDRTIQQQKSRRPHQNENDRLTAVAALPPVDEARLGDTDPDDYQLLKQLDFDVLALGYDQQPEDQRVQEILTAAGKPHAKIVRLPAYRSDKYKSSLLRQGSHMSNVTTQGGLYDLHVHSHYSDGDYTVGDLVEEAKNRGVAGLSLTDHNGLWGCDLAADAAARAGLATLEGIEISARYHDLDIHLLGYSLRFNRSTLARGLAQTREGYQARIETMVRRCHAAGFTKVDFHDIQQRRSHQVEPSYISYDVAVQLQHKHQLTPDIARALTTPGGDCYVPYGDWALHPIEAIELIHEARGLAVIAHPGIIAHEDTAGTMHRLLQELIPHRLDGIEVHHPFHSARLVDQLTALAAEHHLLITGGSDWHGPGRYKDVLGSCGIDEAHWAKLHQHLNNLAI